MGVKVFVVRKILECNFFVPMKEGKELFKQRSRHLADRLFDGLDEIRLEQILLKFQLVTYDIWKVKSIIARDKSAFYKQNK